MEDNSGLNLKELIDKVSYFGKEIWSLKLWIVLSSFVFAAVFVIIAWFTPKYYPAPITFTVNSDEGSGGLSGMIAVLGDLGMGGSQSASNYEKIGALAKSRKIIEQTLKTKVQYKYSEDFLGNILIDEYDITFDDESLNKIRFTDSISIHTNRDYEKVLKKVFRLVIGKPGEKGLIAYDYDDESTVIILKALANNPRLSILLANTHYANLSNYYITNNISKQKETYDNVAQKTDSIYGELRSAESKLAQLSDASRGIILNQNRLGSLRLQRKVEMLYIMYGEALKNKETAQFLLNNATPYFGVIDTPIEPIQVQGKSRISGLIKGGLIGLLFGIGMLIGRRYIVDEIRKHQ